MLQLRTNEKTLLPELTPHCFNFHLLCVTCCHARVTWHRVLSCFRYKESIFHCAETAQKPAHFLTEYSIQTLKKRGKNSSKLKIINNLRQQSNFIVYTTLFCLQKGYMGK